MAVHESLDHTATRLSEKELVTYVLLLYDA